MVELVKAGIRYTHFLVSVIGAALSLGISGVMEVDADDDQAARAYDVGLLAAFRQEHEKALTALNRAIKLDPSLADAHYYLGMLYGARDGWNKALTAFQNATTADPAYIEAYCRMGETYLIELARVNEAVDPLERAVQMDPHHAQGRSLLGTAYFRQNRLNEAIRELQRAVELDPSNTDALYTLGLAHFRQGEIEAASLRFKKIIELDPFYAKAYLNLGNCFRRMGQAENGRKALETFARLTKDEEQIARLERSVRHDDSNVEARYQLGRLQMARGQWEAAAGAFRKCIALRPHEARGYDALGYLYFQLKSYRRALQIYDDVVQRHPDVAQYRNSLGTVYMTIGNYSKAIEQLEAAVQLSPSEPAFHLNLAQIYKRAGHCAKAKEAFYTYQQLKSQNDGGASSQASDKASRRIGENTDSERCMRIIFSMPIQDRWGVEVCTFAKDGRKLLSPNKQLKTYIALCSFLIFLLNCTNLCADNHGIQFNDVTAEAGIDFRHVNGAKGDYHLPETIGSGGAFLDYDTDGDLDLYLVNSGDLTGAASEGLYTSILYRNNSDRTFTDVTDLAGVGNSGNYGMGAACGDYDNDGDPDLYVTNFGANVLYHNNGNGTFTDVTETAGVGDALWGSSATFFDYDHDSYLDLYVVNYVRYSLDVSYHPCGVHGIRTHCHPKNFDGAPDRLYRNNGDGTFTDVTQVAGFGDISGPHSGKGLGVVAADFNNDGEPDLYVANDDTPNFLFYNNGDGTFSEMGLLAGCAFSFDGVAQAGMGVDAGDFNGDGFLDIFVTNLSHETNALYRNNGDGTFSDMAYEANLGKESYLFVGFGTRFFDYDNDGHSDIFIANGHIIEAIAQVTDVLTYAQRNQLFHNNGDGTFAEVSFESGPYFRREGVSRGAIFGDYDNDGDIDIVVTQSNQPAELLRNEGGNRRNWVRIKPVGVVSNRDGIGAQVTVTVGSQSQMQEVHTGLSYLCSNDPRVLFGLGDHTRIDRVEIRWPSGIVQVLKNIAVNQEIVVVEVSE